MVAFTFYHPFKFCPIILIATIVPIQKYVGLVLTSKLTSSNHWYQIKANFSVIKMEFESSLQLIRFLTYSYLNLGVLAFIIYQLNTPLPPAPKGRLKIHPTCYYEGKHTCIVNMTAYNSYHRTVDTFAASKQIANTVMND